MLLLLFCYYSITTSNALATATGTAVTTPAAAAATATTTAATATAATAATATVASLHLLTLPALPTTHNLVNDKPENSAPVEGLARKFRGSSAYVTLKST